MSNPPPLIPGFPQVHLHTFSEQDIQTEELVQREIEQIVHRGLPMSTLTPIHLHYNNPQKLREMIAAKEKGGGDVFPEDGAAAQCDTTLVLLFALGHQFQLQHERGVGVPLTGADSHGDYDIC